MRNICLCTQENMCLQMNSCVIGGGAYGENARNKVPWKNIIVKTLNADADASDIHNIVLNISPSITLIAFPLILFL